MDNKKIEFWSGFSGFALIVTVGMTLFGVVGCDDDNTGAASTFCFDDSGREVCYEYDEEICERETQVTTFRTAGDLDAGPPTDAPVVDVWTRFVGDCGELPSDWFITKTKF